MKKKTDWAPIVKIILDELLYSQKELAKICKVTQQTISNWSTGIRNPSIESKRKMVKIINDSGYQVPEENRPFRLSKTQMPKNDLEELLFICKELSESRKRSLLEFTKFQLRLDTKGEE